MTDIITISGIECYEKNGVVYLKLDTVARGLGFIKTETKKGVEYESVRWDRIGKYLEEFGFDKKWSKNEFIPENIFYRLAMKANNATAVSFQEKVANEVIPSIRRKGYYSMAPVMSLSPEIAGRLDNYDARLNAIENYIIKTGQIARSNQKTLGYIGYGMRRERTARKVTRWQMKAKKKFKALAEHLGVEDRAVLKDLYKAMEDEFDFDLNDYLDEYKYVNDLDQCSSFTVVCTYKELRQRFDAVADNMLERFGVEVDTTLPRRKTIFDDYLAAQAESDAIDGVMA